MNKRKLILILSVCLILLFGVFCIYYFFIQKTTDFYTVERNATPYGKWFDYLDNDPDYKIHKTSFDGEFDDLLETQGFIRGAKLRAAKEEIFKVIPDTADYRYREAVDKLYYNEEILLSIKHTRNNKIEDDLIKDLVRVQNSVCVPEKG